MMNSVLNPEAPEFIPLLKCRTQDGYTSVKKAVRAACILSRGAYNYYKTFDDFNILANRLSNNIILQSNQILQSKVFMVPKLKKNSIDHNSDLIILANDNVLDSLNVKIDTVSGENNLINPNLVKFANVSSWNQTPVIAKIQMGSAWFIGAKNIPRPQLTFKDQVDNSDSLWVPKITYKPNNIKPLALNIIYNDEGEAVGYEHPYKVELDLYKPPERYFKDSTVENQMPVELNDSKFSYIDTLEDLETLVQHLNDVSEIAVDVEHHSYRTYQGITCLIQISTDDGDFVIDTLALREHIHKLNQAFTDPNKTKVFHGAEQDVIWLQRDFGVYIVGLFDTHQASKLLKLSKLSLKYLLFKYCKVDVDKKYQLADWRIRPLPDDLVAYARMDTHYLLYIWRKMRSDLLQADDNPPRLLLSVFEQSRQICGKTYNKEIIKDDSHMSLYYHSKKQFNSQQMSALKMLYQWRDAQARTLDESVTYLLPNHMLVKLAESLPREVQGVNACCNPMPPFVKQNVITIHRMILSCRELPLEPQLYQMPSSLRAMVNAHDAYHSLNVHDLTDFPEHRDESCINLDWPAEFYSNECLVQPDIQAFQQNHNEIKKKYMVSDLNVDAKQFIPPYDRYRKYRSLAQLEELKEFKEKEAKIAAIGKGNELIKKEVLVKIQQAKQKAEVTSVIDLTEDSSDSVVCVQKEKKAVMRKRKLLNDGEEFEQKLTGGPIENDPVKLKYTESNKKKEPYNYKNENYKKFYNAGTSSQNQQPKMRFNKKK